MVSRYPNAIDGYSDIRIVRDGIEEVLARDHNDNRSAIVAIEQSLGIRPQGLYGTVVARLDQADTDFGEHISGTAHRHVTNHIDYPGSSPKVFQDGYALVASRLGSTLNEIVARLGASTPAGSSGGDKIGTTPFVTEHAKYSFPGSSVRSQLVKDGQYLDENATLLERALDAFVVDGMGVTDPYGTGNTARIAAGHIFSDGRLLRYNGADIAVPSPGTFYVWARASSGSVSVGIDDATLPSQDPLNPFVLLKKIVRPTPGSVWTSDSTDIRRFGVFTNNKDFFSVGGPNSPTTDGYGCDFLSLKGAVDYIRAMASVVPYNVPRKIVLVDDVGISSDEGLNIALDAWGIEIDGCGKTVFMTGFPTQPLFLVDTSQVRIHDLTVITAGLSSYGCFAQLGVTVDVDDVQIVRCGSKTVPGAASPTNFVVLGNAAGTLAVSDAVIADNTAGVSNGGIVYATGASYEQVLRASRVTGNHIYQDTLATTDGYGIQASTECVVSDNVIFGGFGYGIAAHAPISTLVSNNLITGTDSSAAYMPTGIGLVCPGPNGNEYGATVAGNIIRGINNGYGGGYGIDAKAGAKTGRQTIIANNIIDNGNITTWPMYATGIRVNRYEIPVIGNQIIWMGYPIDRASIVIGNEIYGHGVNAGNGILCVSSAASAVVCDNTIYNLDCSGSVINLGGSDHAVVCGNVIRECVTSGAGIDLAGSNHATVVGNVIYHSTGATGTTGINNIGADSVVCANTVTRQSNGAFHFTGGGADRVVVVGNKAYNCGSHGIEMTDSADCVVADNILVVDDPALSPGVGIGGFASNCVVFGNAIRGYAAGGYYGIDGDFGPYRSTAVIGNLVVGLHANTQGAIHMAGGWRDTIVSNNIICDTKYRGIDMSGSARVVVTGNLLLGTANSRSGIYSVGQYSIVANNAVLNYGNGGMNNVGISLLDAYSSAVVGNTIAGGADLTRGIYLDVTVATLDNLIASNVLNGINHYGIDLNAGASGRHVVANNLIIGMGASNNEPAIENLSSQSVAIGNCITGANGDGIHVTAGILGYGFSLGSTVIGNTIEEPDAYGINVDHVGGLVRFDGASDFNSCLVSGNHLSRSDGDYGGIYLADSWRTTIVGNFVRNFGTGIWLLGISNGCIDNLVCGNNIQQDPILGIGHTGIMVDAGCSSNNVVGNFIFGSVFGIDVNANLVSVMSNHIVWCRNLGLEVGCGIEASGTIDTCIVGNMVGPGFPLALAVDGINVYGCLKTLVVGNLAFGYLSGLSFRIDDAQPANGLVMSGNLARDGFAAPSMGTGVGATWPANKITDVDCRYMTP